MTHQYSHACRNPTVEVGAVRTKKIPEFSPTRELACSLHSMWAASVVEVVEEVDPKLRMPPPVVHEYCGNWTNSAEFESVITNPEGDV